MAGGEEDTEEMRRQRSERSNSTWRELTAEEKRALRHQLATQRGMPSLLSPPGSVKQRRVSVSGSRSRSRPQRAASFLWSDSDDLADAGCLCALFCGRPQDDYVIQHFQDEDIMGVDMRLRALTATWHATATLLLTWALLGLGIMVGTREMTHELGRDGWLSTAEEVMHGLQTASTAVALRYLYKLYSVEWMLVRVTHRTMRRHRMWPWGWVAAFLCEAVVVAVHEPPFYDTSVDMSVDVDVRVLVLNPWGLLMFMRLYLFARLGRRFFRKLHHPVLTSITREGLSTGTMFRQLVSSSPVLIFTASILFTGLVLSYALTVCERDDANGSFASFSNAAWAVAMTLSLVGYGELVPASYCGRSVLIIAATVGVVFTAILVTSMHQAAHLLPHEMKVMNFFQAKKRDNDLVRQAAIVIQRSWRYATARNRAFGRAATGRPKSLQRQHTARRLQRQITKAGGRGPEQAWGESRRQSVSSRYTLSRKASSLLFDNIPGDLPAATRALLLYRRQLMSEAINVFFKQRKEVLRTVSSSADLLADLTNVVMMKISEFASLRVERDEAFVHFYEQMQRVESAGDTEEEHKKEKEKEKEKKKKKRLSRSFKDVSTALTSPVADEQKTKLTRHRIVTSKGVQHPHDDDDDDDDCDDDEREGHEGKEAAAGSGVVLHASAEHSHSSSSSGSSDGGGEEAVVDKQKMKRISYLMAKLEDSIKRHGL